MMIKNLLTTLISVVIVFGGSVQVDAAGKDNRRNPHYTPVKVLPRANHRLVHKGTPYYYATGRFYRYADGVYRVVVAPVGVVVPVLPNGSVSFLVGSKRIYYFQGTYYRPVDAGYEVIDEPPEAQQLLIEGSDKLIVYPGMGQSDELREKDRYECHLWASDETHYDPRDEYADPLLSTDYYRALAACLEARNYVVK